jgi:hypothetical protein
MEQKEILLKEILETKKILSEYRTFLDKPYKPKGDIMKKNAFKSKTIWTNVLMAIVAVVAPELVSPQIAAYIITGVNVILRLITKEPIKIPNMHLNINNEEDNA